MLSDQEKWQFDLYGYLLLKQAVSPQDVDHMVQLCDQWQAKDDSELPAPLKSYSDASTKPTSHRSIERTPKPGSIWM